MYQEKCAVINTNPSLGIGKWIPKSCNDTNGFICLQKIDSSLPVSPEPTPSSNYIKILNDSIKLVPKNMSWDEAKKHCEDDGANLASVRSEWTQAYIELLALNLKSPLWIGLNKAQTNGYFKFVDGWFLKFTNWDRYEPKSFRNCVFVDVDGKWKTSDCNQTISSVCMKSTDVPPTDKTADFPGVCPEDPYEIFSWRKVSWKPFRGYCYLFISEQKSWSDASVSCIEHGGMLVSIEDTFEQQFIKRNIEIFQDSHPSYWLGLFTTKNGVWQWLDKTVLDYTNWHSDDIESLSFGRSSHRCRISTSDGKWIKDRGWMERPYICKTAKVLTDTLSPSSVSPNIGSNPSGRGHIILAVVLVIAGLAAGTVVALFFFKKSGHYLPIHNRLTNFDNPLFFGNNRTQSGLVDSKTLVENADEENTLPVVNM
ncbi:macrophage mannose receptor 1 isoform X2 [Austrofundulus limnaeus]|nr:PREDICTED: macrophage mannose receptor 1-like isoform X2 [Austrofundulus limnaeus]